MSSLAMPATTRSQGRRGGDSLFGGGGDDVLIGGNGYNTMTGGAGNDTFVYNAFNESGIGAGNSDVITDFEGASSPPHRHYPMSGVVREV